MFAPPPWEMVRGSDTVPLPDPTDEGISLLKPCSSPRPVPGVWPGAGAGPEPGVHGSAQRLEQGLELQRCTIGQLQFVDMAAHALQI